MADEFFRPYLRIRRLGARRSSCPGLWYNAMIGNNSSSLGVTSSQLDRTFSTGGFDVVDADDEGVRPARRVRRLGAARKGRDALRLLHDAEPRGALHRRQHGRYRTTPRSGWPTA